MRQDQHTIVLASGIGSRVMPPAPPAGTDPWEGVAQVVLLPTEACNLRCVYCYQGHEPKRMSPEIRRSVLALLERLAEKDGIRRLHIDWYGGEPLAAWPIMVEIGEAAQRLAARSGKRLSMSMTTNGTLLTRKRIERLTAWGCTDYQITVDGPPAEHDRRRVTQGGAGSFAGVWAALTSLRDSRGEYRVVVRLGVDRANLQAFLDWLPELALELGGDPRFEFSCRPISYPDGRAPQFSPAEVKKVQQLVADELRKVGLQPVDWSRESRPGGLGCHAGRANSVMIGPGGELHKCAVGLELPENHVGWIGEDGTLRLDQERWQSWVGAKIPCRVAERARGSKIPRGFKIPNLTLPLAPQAACPLGPEASCPLSPQAACPLGPEASCPLSPQAACPLGPEASCPLSPQAACPLGPEASCPLSPQAACPLGPEASCPLSPEAACPLGPEASCPLSPHVVAPPPRVDFYQMRAA